MELTIEQIKSALSKAKEKLKSEGEPLSDNQVLVIWDSVKDKLPKEINIKFEEIWEKYRPLSKMQRKQAEKYWYGMSDRKRQVAFNRVHQFAAFKPFEKYKHPSLYQYLKHERYQDVEDPKDLSHNPLGKRESNYNHVI